MYSPHRYKTLSSSSQPSLVDLLLFNSRRLLETHHVTKGYVTLKNTLNFTFLSSTIETYATKHTVEGFFPTSPPLILTQNISGSRKVDFHIFCQLVGHKIFSSAENSTMSTSLQKTRCPFLRGFSVTLSCLLPAKPKAADLEPSIPLLFALPPEKLH